MRSASAYCTLPSAGATMQAPESRATSTSMPVPTRGFSERSSGTAWRCMLEPISARLASSCSRKGISAAEMETIWLGEMSMRVTSSRWRISTSPLTRTVTYSSSRLPSASMRASAWATTWSPSREASRWTTSLVSLASRTTR